ncbi:MAG: hypothetical protein WD873_03015, partial [Candidatus Hydrogenedentales bacterium]
MIALGIRQEHSRKATPMRLNRRCQFVAQICATAGLALALMASTLEAAAIGDFHIYAQNNVTIGVGTIVGTTAQNSLVGAGTMVVGVGDANLNGGAGIYGSLRAGDDVSLANNTFVTGTITNPGSFSTGSGVVFGSHIVAMPDLPTLPAASVFADGVTDVGVGNGGTMNLAPGSWNDITLGGAATLNLSAGDYYLKKVMAGNGLTINVDLNGGDLRLFITEDFNAGGVAAMNFTSGGDWHNVSAETHQTGLNAFRIGGGNGTQWFGSIF